MNVIPLESRFFRRLLGKQNSLFPSGPVCIIIIIIIIIIITIIITIILKFTPFPNVMLGCLNYVSAPARSSETEHFPQHMCCAEYGQQLCASDYGWYTQFLMPGLSALPNWI